MATAREGHMSFRAQQWAYNLRGLTGPEKAVLNCLAWHHNGKTGLCCPGPALIAEETGFGLSTVKKALASLIAKGLIARLVRGRGGAYGLAITEPAKAPTEPRHIEQESNQRAGLRFDKKDSGGQERAAKRAAEFKAVIEPEVRLPAEDRARIAEAALARFRSGGSEAGLGYASDRGRSPGQGLTAGASDRPESLLRSRT